MTSKLFLLISNHQAILKRQGNEIQITPGNFWSCLLPLGLLFIQIRWKGSLEYSTLSTLWYIYMYIYFRYFFCTFLVKLSSGRMSFLLSIIMGIAQYSSYVFRCKRKLVLCYMFSFCSFLISVKKEHKT